MGNKFVRARVTLWDDTGRSYTFPIAPEHNNTITGEVTVTRNPVEVPTSGPWREFVGSPDARIVINLAGLLGSSEED